MMKQFLRRPRGARRLRGFPSALALACAALTAGFAAASGGPRQEPASVEDTRAVLDEWMQTEKLIYEERRDWQLKRELLESRIALVGAELASVRESIAAEESELATGGAEAAAAAAALADREAAAEAFRAEIVALEERTRALLARLPDAAVERVRLLIPRLPEDSAASQEGLGRRYLTVIGILNQLNKFNAELSSVNETRALPDGSMVAVRVLYAGLSCAWYVSEDGRYAGYGSAAGGAWTWTAMDEHAETIGRALAIHGGDEEAGYVRLPLPDARKEDQR